MMKLLILILSLSMMMGTTASVLERRGAEEVEVKPSQEEHVRAFEEKNVRDWFWISWPVDEIREWQDCCRVEGQILDNPRDGWLTKEEAISNAKNALMDLGGTYMTEREFGPIELNEELLDEIEHNAIVCAETENGQNLWIVWFYDRMWSETGFMNEMEVWVDAENGEIINLMTPESVG